MRQIIATFLLVIMTSAGTVSAWDYTNIPIGGLYYNLDVLNLAAEVTAMLGDYYIGDVTIPATVDYNSQSYDVKGIGEKAFTDCTGLTSVTIPNGITSIGTSAFAGCSALTSVTIPESVATLNYGGTFQRCANLRSVQWNAVECELKANSPGNYSSPFYELDNLTSFTFGEKVKVLPPNLCFSITGLTIVTIPENISSFGTGGTFQNCTNLRSVQWNAIRCTIDENENGDGNYYPPFNHLSSITSFTFGEKVEVIPASLCYGLTGLISITIPASVTSIGRIAFRQCTGLTSVTIPENVTNIGIRAFRDCKGLKTVILSGSVATIRDNAFTDCTGLASITCEALVPPALGEDVFLNVDKSIPLYVHCPYAALYKAAEQWKEFRIGCDDLSATIAQDCSANGKSESASHPLPDPEHTLVLYADGCGKANTYTCYEGQNATMTAVPQDGYVFKRWDDGNTDNPRSVSVTTDMSRTAFFAKEGCDGSDATITVSLQDTAICFGETLIWNNVEYTESGTITQNLNSITGCDSIVTRQLTVLPKSEGHESKTIYKGETYSWNGQEYDATDVYSAEGLTDRNGCDSTAYLHLTVSDKPVSDYDSIVFSVSVADHCADDPYIDFLVDVTEGAVDKVRFAFDDKARRQGFRDTTVTSAGGVIQIANRARAGRYEAAVTCLYAGQESETGQVPFTLLYPGTVLEQNWDDFIAVLTHDYNGGYDFTAYQWFENGEPMEGQTRSYIYNCIVQGNRYSALLTEQDGTQLMTCELEAVHREDISVYPTLVRRREAFRVRTSGPASVDLYDATGRLVMTCHSGGGETQLSAPPDAGLFLLRVRQDGDGNVKPVKLMVR